MPARLKRSRIGRPKTRTGCTVCKTRRIKCDEGHPSCQKCVTAGWECEYRMKSHTSVLRDSHTKLIKPQPPVVLAPRLSFSPHHAPSRELRSLQYFLLNSASSISGVFTSDFWNIQLPQAASKHKAVHHAVVAVASLHEAGVNTCSTFLGLSSPSPDEMILQQRFAIQQYNIALQATHRMLSNFEDGMELVALLNCVLFICFEFLQSRFNVAAVHLHNGLQIMKEWHQSARELKGQAADLKNNLVQIFDRLSISSIMMDEPLADICSRTATPPAVITNDRVMFRNMNEARNKLNTLLLHSLTKRKLCEELCISRVDPRRPNMVAYLSALHSQLANWLASFTTFLKHRKTILTSREDAALHVLHRTQLATSIWASTALSPLETAYDAHFPAFLSIIEHVEQQFANERESGRVLHDCTLETGFLSHTYFVARKCRERTIRRRAVKMLAMASPRQEGVCKAGMLTGAAKRIVEIEEEGMTPFNSELDNGDGSEGCEGNRELPREEKRIVDTCGVAGDNIWVQDWKEGRWGVEDHDLMLLHEKATFCTRPRGLDFPMEFRTEVVECCLSDSKTMRG